MSSIYMPNFKALFDIDNPENSILAICNKSDNNYKTRSPPK